MSVCTVEEAIEEIRRGNMVIVVDDEDRENEGDLTIAAEFATPEAINFMARYGRGLICLPMAGEFIDRLELPMMTENNKSGFGTPFTVSIEARSGVTTGISAQDRSTTILTAVRDDVRPEDIVSPGHVFPLRANPNGVLGRTGQTEGGVDLARLAGLKPAAVICEVMRDDGEMARMPDLAVFAKEHGVKIVTIADMIRYRVKFGDMIVERVAEAKMPTRHGDFNVIAFKSNDGDKEFLALIKGDFTPGEPVLTRVHRQCPTGDFLGSTLCDCGQLLQSSMNMISEEGGGVVLYIRRDYGDIGTCERLKKDEACNYGAGAVAGDLRDYGMGAQILVSLGVTKLRLITNNTRKLVGLEGYGLEVVERIPVETHCAISEPAEEAV